MKTGVWVYTEPNSTVSAIIFWKNHNLVFGTAFLDGVRKFVQAKRQKSHCLLLFCGISQICALVGSFRGEKTVSTTTGSSVVFSGLSFLIKRQKWTFGATLGVKVTKFGASRI